MTLAFIDTHNMVAYLSKSDASEGFNQIIDFLNESYIEYALTMNPTIYVSCIKQFWNTVAIKLSNDVTSLQALVDKKKVVVTEAAIRDSMSAKRTSWNEFSSAMASAVICLSTGDLSTHTTKYIFPALTQKVFANMKRAGKGCSGVGTSLFEGMLVAREPEEQGDAEEQSNDDNAAEEPVTTVDDGEKLERANKVKTLKLRRLRKVGTSQRIESSDDTIIKDVSNQGRMIDELDKDEGAVLMKENDETEEVKDITAQVEGSETVNVAPVVPTVTTVVVPIITTAPVKVAVLSTRQRRRVVIRDPEEESSVKTPTETKSKDKGKAMDHVKQKAKENLYVQRYQTMKKIPQTEAQAQRNMMMYLKNTAGFRMDYFKGMSYDDICPIFEAKFNSNIKFLLKSKEQMEEEENRAIASINETLAQKAAKRRRLNEEAKDVEELKQHLEIVPDEYDDVYTEATPLARKNFDREDLESLWSIVKERFSTSKPNNFLDDFLLTILKAMFGRPDEQDQVWMNQKSVHGQEKVKSWKMLESCRVHIVALTTTQLIMLVERRYPLSRFTLDQMLNTVRLRVEEQSEMSLELIIFTRQQLQEGQHN
uniref:Xylulose kinase-1 n=1 Tax=Tanacetum cinerariifolium TaxID=118510 RepID=A0A699HWM8_TANCI|nr:hypothetical protein [Tanacetum cinerariifolium]